MFLQKFRLDFFSFLLMLDYPIGNLKNIHARSDFFLDQRWQKALSVFTGFNIQTHVSSAHLLFPPRFQSKTLSLEADYYFLNYMDSVLYIEIGELNGEKLQKFHKFLHTT